MKQIVTSTTVNVVDYRTNYTETNNLLVLSGKTIITNPKLINSGKMVLDKVIPKFEMIRTYSSSYIELASDDPFYVKIIIDEDFDASNNSGILAAFTIKTSRFSYCNQEQPIIIAVGNGTFSVDPSTGELVPNEYSKNISIEFVFGAHDLSYSNANFSSWSSITGSEF